LICRICKARRLATWNKTGICSACQQHRQYRATNPYGHIVRGRREGPVENSVYSVKRAIIRGIRKIEASQKRRYGHVPQCRSCREGCKQIKVPGLIKFVCKKSDDYIQEEKKMLEIYG